MAKSEKRTKTARTVEAALERFDLSTVRFDYHRFQGLLGDLAACSRHDGEALDVPGISTWELIVMRRLAELFSDPHLSPHNPVEVNFDPVGNMYAVLHGKQPDKPGIVLGTHLDTVRRGGRYDGRFQAVCSLMTVSLLSQLGIRLNRNLIFPTFRCEEGDEFGVGSLGSKLVTGIWEAAEFLQRRNQSGHKGRDGLMLRELLERETIHPESRRFVEVSEDDINHRTGYGSAWVFRDPSAAHQARIQRIRDEWAIYLEAHIEQSGLLPEDRPVAVADRFAAPERFLGTVKGQSGHTGGVPLFVRNEDAIRRFRADPVVLLGRMITAFDEVSREFFENESSHRATITSIDVAPGGKTEIPSTVKFFYEIRDVDDDRRAVIGRAIDERFRRELEQFNAELADARRVKLSVEQISYGKAAGCDPRCVGLLKYSSKWAGVGSCSLDSMAWHDAGNAALSGVPTGMLLIRCNTSHNPDERVEEQDVIAGLRVMFGAVLAADELLTAQKVDTFGSVEL